MGEFNGGLRQLLVLAATVLLAGCKSLPLPPLPGPAPEIAGHAPDLASLEAMGRPTDWSELSRLAGQQGSLAVQLRRSRLYLRVRRPDKAKLILDELFSTPGLSREGKALAGCFMAMALRDQGMPSRASFHRDQARRLTHNARLRTRLDTMPMEISEDESWPERKIEPVNTPPRLAIQSRSYWRAAPPVKSRIQDMGRITRLTVHHAGFPCPNRSAAGIGDHLRRIQRNHKTGKTRWADIGYHYLIDPEGRIWEGRQIAYQGAHAGNPSLNKGNVGICFLGNWLYQAPPTAALTAMRQLVKALMAEYKIPARRIFCHKELKTTACPGPFIQREVKRLRNSL